MVIDWQQVFDEIQLEPPLDTPHIDAWVDALLQPLSPAEIASINQSQQNPFTVKHPLHATWQPFDPSLWTLPDRPISQQYRQFLQVANGGWARTGEREFGFFGIDDVRSMLLAYHVPQYMPQALPFALNGGGVFYLFDMRQPARDSEYPIVCASAGNLGWGDDEHLFLAEHFVAACQGKCNVEDLM